MRTNSHWTSVLDRDESLDVYRDFALWHAERAGLYGQRQIAPLIRKGDIRALCDLAIDYSDRWEPEELYHARQSQAYFQKIESLELGIDREAAAHQTFVDSEAVCRETNNIFRLWSRGEFLFTPSTEAALFLAQRKIAKVLGRCPTFEQLGYRFGKGATTLTKKRMASMREKFRAGASCSEDLLPAAKAVLAEIPGLTREWSSFWMSDSDEFQASVPVEIHDGRLEFVPKNYKTFRSVVVEPVLNGMGQMALGDIIARKLKRFGLDITDQSLNQRLAREGSLTGALATLDLSAASDTIATELVYHLLPLDWACMLARFRTGHVLYAGKRYKLEKFSSMGNGFTFPLETLIFWSLVSAVCDEADTVSVYGDDIICPSLRFGDVSAVLRDCGFTVNGKKSYATGPFRESCGSDWYEGYAVRPVYPREWVSGRSLFILHNFYKRAGRDWFAERILERIHPALQIFGPDGYGDGHLIGDYIPRRSPSQVEKGYSGSRFSTFTLKTVRDIRPQFPSDSVLPAYSVYRRTAEQVVSLATSADSISQARFLRIWRKGHGDLSDTRPIPELPVTSGPGKADSLPGGEADLGYKRIDIYTFRN